VGLRGFSRHSIVGNKSSGSTTSINANLTIKRRQTQSAAQRKKEEELAIAL